LSVAFWICSEASVARAEATSRAAASLSASARAVAAFWAASSCLAVDSALARLTLARSSWPITSSLRLPA
jgi:hypothetical protein